MRRTLLVLLSTSCAFGQRPAIQAVQNAASGVSSGVVPQMLVAIFGSNLAAQNESAKGFPLPERLAGTSVTFNGIPAPLLYVSGGQVNAQVPSVVQGLTSANVVVTTASGASDPFPVGVISGRAPGMFTTDASGCGQAAALNIHADGSLTPNTPQNSFDPLNDRGIALFATGLGPVSDRADGTAWQFNPADNLSRHISTILGYMVGDVNAMTTSLPVAYAGPAPDTAGVDQVNGMYFGYLDPKHAFVLPLPEGCRVPLLLSSDGSSDLYSPPVNVSIHSGGGPCIDPPANSLGIVTWQRTVTSDANGTSSTSSVKMEFLQAPNILGFERPPVVSVSSVGSYGFLRLPPAVCPASYPTTLDAGAIALSGPDFGPLSLQPQNQKGLVGYQASLPDTAGQGGEYLVTARGGPAVGAFSAEATLPPPITITNDLRPGTSIRLPFTLSWTGGDSDSVVTVQLIAHIPGQATPLLFATSLASDGTRPLPLPPAEVPYSFPLHTEVEIIVTQQPAKVPSRPFSAAGLTLGGEQTWKYVFDFKALRSQ